MNPEQAETARRILDTGGDRPHFAAGLVGALEDRFTELTADIEIPHRNPIKVSKGSLQRVFDCEGFVDEFVPNANLYRGQLVHRSVRHTLFEAPRAPRAVVADEIDEFRSDPQFGQWWATQTDPARAELRRDVEAGLTTFHTMWPKIDPDWRPVSEAAMHAILRGGDVALRGEPDLVLGGPRGTEARMFVCDIKSSGTYEARHRNEARFYALLTTLRWKVPPYRAAVVSLAGGEHVVEIVTAELLEAELRRVADGVRKLAALRAGAEPSLSPGAHCRWCAAAQTCPEAPDGTGELGIAEHDGDGADRAGTAI